jgi:starvation-inducible DNA-binding protein
VYATHDISEALTTLLADIFALYVKTKNFHWHMLGQHFRDYHLLLDQQSEQIFAATDAIAERVRKIGGTTLRSIGQIRCSQRVLDNDAEYVTPLEIVAELRDDNKQLAALCVRRTDCATSMETWPAQACSRIGLPRPSDGAHGSCSKLVARASPLDTLMVRDAAGYAIGVTAGRYPWPIQSKSMI